MIRKGGTSKAIRNLTCWLIILSMIVLAIGSLWFWKIRLDNYTELHRRVRALEYLHD